MNGGQDPDFLARELAREIAARMAAERRVDDVGRDLYLAKTAAEEALRAKSEFLQNMSHELRTPLNAVTGFTSILQKRLAGRISGEEMDFLNLVANGGQDLLRIINQILEMSRLQSGQYVFEPARVAIADLFESCIDIRQPQIRDAEIQVVRLLPPAISDIVADRSALTKCLLMVLDNAIKFSDKGGEVMLTADPAEQDVEIVVADHGIGIPAEMLHRVTEPFFQVENGFMRRHGGVGLGLAIARTLVERQGGRIRIVSHAGAGTSVHLRMPVA
jgi:signal transduction histidine kinase